MYLIELGYKVKEGRSSRSYEVYFSPDPTLGTGRVCSRLINC